MKTAELTDWALHLAMSGMPIDLCSAIGARLAPSMGKKINPAEHARALHLFARLRPEWSLGEAGCEAAVDRLWGNVGRTFAEFSVSHRMLRSGRIEIADLGRLDAAAASGRPIVAIFPHLGNWEVSEMQLGALLPHRVAVIYAPPANQTRARIAHNVRRKIPFDLLPISRIVWRHTLAKLKTPGGIAMIAVDEEAFGRVWGPALGRPIRLDGNLGKVARLALATNAIVLPFYNERVDGARFVTHYLPALEFTGKSSDDGAVAAAVQQMDAVMSEPIVRLLDQWYMALSFTD